MRRTATVIIAALAVAAALPASASADITGTITTPRGAPIPGADVRASDANGNFASSATTDAAGKYKITTSGLSGDTPPFTLKFSDYEPCSVPGQTSSSRESQAGPVNDGAAVDGQLDRQEFCIGGFGSTEGTAFIDGVNHQIISAPGGTGTLQVLARSGATGYAITLADGSVVASGTDPTKLALTAPQSPYNGPMTLNYTDSTAGPISFILGQLVVAAIAPPAPASGNIDLEAIVDVSGSMGSNDRQYRRKDAVSLLLDLATTGDKLGAVGFDSDYQPIFDLTTITGQAVINQLKGVANQKIQNLGGTNYNIGFQKAYEALTGPGVDQRRPKAAIFLTDGGHNSGAYQNGHLRFAINPSGHSWPVCVVQLGTGFQPEDVTRLQRIANETGGQYAATPTNDQLTALYFSCLGRTTGAKTLVEKTLTFRPGQQRAVAQKLPKKKLPAATFFLGWGNGTYDLKLKDPKGKLHTPKKPGRGGSFGRGNTYAFYRIRRPDGGRWKMLIKAVKLDTPTDKASVKITAAPRK